MNYSIFNHGKQQGQSKIFDTTSRLLQNEFLVPGVHFNGTQQQQHPGRLLWKALSQRGHQSAC